MLGLYYWDRLSWVEFETLVKDLDLVVLPVGSVEQHGPHLPLGLDYLIVDELSKRFVIKAYEVGIKAVKLPPIAYGLSSMWLGNPGTITVNFDSFMSYVYDVIKAVLLWGVKRVLLLNGHAGNSDALRVVASKIVNELKGDHLIVVTTWWELVGDIIKELFPKGFFHADEVETSIALALGIDVKGDLEGSSIHRKYDEFWHSLDLTKRPKAYVYRYEAVKRVPGSYGTQKGVSYDKGATLVNSIIDRLIKLTKDLLHNKI